MTPEDYVVIPKRLLDNLLEKETPFFKANVYDQSKPLLPIISDAFDAGMNRENENHFGHVPNKVLSKQDYLNKEI